MRRNAEFSECKKYRYLLTRIWDKDKPYAQCIGLNPSTANGDDDDPTISHLVNILQNLGYGGLYMTNLFALITPKPEELRASPDPVGDNSLWMLQARDHCRDVIYCWGDFPMAVYRAKLILKLFPRGWCFGQNKSGSPKHPMALWRAGIKNHNVTLTNFQ